MRYFILLLLLTSLHVQAGQYDALLFHGNCTTCHFENKTVSAPSMQEVRLRYLTAFPQKKDFVVYMATWVKHPDEKTSIMLDAIEKHGLMPELAFDFETLQSISSYIYDTDFSKNHPYHKTKK